MKFLRTLILLLLILPVATPAQDTSQSAPLAPPASILDTPADFAGWTGEAADPARFDTIRIGFFAPDRPDDPIGVPMRNAAMLALDQVNAAGGYHGVPVGLIQRWSDNPWGAGSKKMIRLVYEDSVWAVIGSLDGAFTHIAEQIVTKAWVPLLSPVSADPTLNYVRIPWMFRLPPGDDKQAAVIVRHGLQTRSLERIGLITSTDHDGRIFAKEMLDQLNTAGRPPLFHFKISLSNVDLREIASRALLFQPDAIILRFPGEATRKLVTSLDENSANIPLFLPWIPGLQRADLTARYHGEIHSVQPFRMDDNPRYAGFAKIYRKHYGQSPTPTAAYTYDALQLVLKALKASGLTRAGIRGAVAGMSGFQGVTGTIRWDNGWANQGEPVLE